MFKDKNLIIYHALNKICAKFSFSFFSFFFILHKKTRKKKGQGKRSVLFYYKDIIVHQVASSERGVRSEERLFFNY